MKRFAVTSVLLGLVAFAPSVFAQAAGLNISQTIEYRKRVPILQNTEVIVARR